MYAIENKWGKWDQDFKRKGKVLQNLHALQQCLYWTSYLHTASCFLTGGGQGKVSGLDLRSYHQSHGFHEAFSGVEHKDLAIFPKSPAQAVNWA